MVQHFEELKNININQKDMQSTNTLYKNLVVEVQVGEMKISEISTERGVRGMCFISNSF